MPGELPVKMEPEPPVTPLRPRVVKWRLALAFAIAGVSDVISAVATFALPIEWAVDLVTALLLFVVLGWQWLLLPGLIMEAMSCRWRSRTGQ